MTGPRPTYPEGRNPFPLTDLGNAERFAFMHADRLRFVPAWGSWLVWDDRRWRRDDLRRVHRLAWETVRAIYDEGIAQEDKKDKKATLVHAVRSESEARIRAMVNLAQSHHTLVMSHTELDADPWLLNVENGTIDLRLGTLRAHRQADLMTRLAPVVFDAEAECPRWLAFLTRIMNGREELVAFLQRAIGYSLTGDTREQCLFFLYGTGQNGKSTFVELFLDLLGDYAATADFSTFLERRSEGPRNDVAGLAGARFVSSIEASEGKRFNTALVKSLTGGDRIKARFLYAELFEFKPLFKLWLAANHKPAIPDTTISIWRRIKLVPFTVQIPDAEKDEGLPAALRAELPGILRWAVEGCQAWLETGLRAPEEVKAATEKYRAESDLLAEFLEECCERDPGASVQATELFKTYKAWAEEGKEHAMTQTKFGRELEARGFAVAKLGTGQNRLKYRLGLRLLNGHLSPSGTDGDSQNGDSVKSLHSHPSRNDFSENSPNRPQPSPDFFDLDDTQDYN